MKKSELKVIIRECIEEVVNEGGGSRRSKEDRQYALYDKSDKDKNWFRDLRDMEQKGKDEYNSPPYGGKNNSKDSRMKNLAIRKKYKVNQRTRPKLPQ